MSLNIKEILPDFEFRLNGAINSLKHALSGLRTGRVSASLLDPVKAEIYGSEMPINQLSAISTSDAKTLVVQVWDKENIKSIMKAIAGAGLGLNPENDGGFIRIKIPDLTEDRRKELAKKANEYLEGSKVAMRNIRRDVIDLLRKKEKAKELSEDELKVHISEIQKLIDQHIEKAEDITVQKSKEIMSL